jgi:hypothetical protein
MRLVGIAPLFLAEYENQPTLLLNGSIEISDYLDLIVRKDDHAKFLTGLLDFLASTLPDNWSALDWYNLPDISPPSPHSKRNPPPAAGLITRKSIVPHRALP